MSRSIPPSPGNSPLALTLDPEALRPVVAEVVREVLAQLDQVRATLPPDRLAYSEPEAARLLGLAPHQLRDERLRGRITASKIVGRQTRDLHEEGTIVLISHASCVQELARASRHRRIRTAHFGALRGRNDLESRPDNPIACHIVAGSPKTTEEDRRRLALAVFGESILPFADLETVRRGVVGRVPSELCPGEEAALWDVQLKGYRDPRMQAIYDHTVTAELTHTADRARVLVHASAVVYLVTNEPCPKLWFAEMCLADEFLDLSRRTSRSDFQRNCATCEQKALELLNAGGPSAMRTSAGRWTVSRPGASATGAPC